MSILFDMAKDVAGPVIGRRIMIGLYVAGALAIVAGVWAAVDGLKDAGRDVEKAQSETRTQRATTRVVAINRETAAAVAEETGRLAETQVRIERETQTIIREVKAHVAAQTPIPADLAHTWIAGLERLCDDAGPDACGSARRDDEGDAGNGAAGGHLAVAGNKPVPQGDAPR